jgi:hypothetical protein
MQQLAYVLPPTYAIRDIRAAALADADIAAMAQDLARLAAFAVLLPAVGVIAFSLMERRARRTGTLGQY